MAFTLDPEIKIALREVNDKTLASLTLPVGKYLERRKQHESTLQKRNPQIPPGVTKKDYHVPTSDSHRMLCRLYTKIESPAPDRSSVVLYLHGGGYILGNVPLFDGVCGDYVLHTGVPFFSVQYRLAPEFPYPVPLKDAYDALLWLHSHAIDLGIDADRIAVMGDSAGGGLAAALTHYNLENQGPRIAKQILIYPMLDDRNTNMDNRIAPFATWNGVDNETGWDCLLGPLRGTAGVPPSAAPARMKDPRGLPDLFMDVAELDHFRRENIAYAAMFVETNMSAEIHVRPGCPHGWELIAPKAWITSKAMEDRWHAIRRI